MVITVLTATSANATVTLSATAEQPGIGPFPMTVGKAPATVGKIRPGALRVRIGSSAEGEPIKTSIPGSAPASLRPTESVPGGNAWYPGGSFWYLDVYREAEGLYTVVMPNPVPEGILRFTVRTPEGFSQFLLRVAPAAAKAAVPVRVKGKEPKFELTARVAVFNRQIPTPELRGTAYSIGLGGEYVVYVSRGGRRVSTIIGQRAGTVRRFALRIKLDDHNKIFSGGKLVFRRGSVTGPILFSKQLAHMSGWIDG